MKKLKILLLSLIIIIPQTITAESLELSLKCPEKTSAKRTINCIISSSSPTPINGLKIKYNINEDITYNQITKTNNWHTHYDTKTGIILSKSNNQTLNEEVATFSLTMPNLSTIKSEYTISLTDIEASDTNYNLLSANDVSATIKIVSDDNTLSNLTITNANLSPTFNKDKTEYKATTTKDTTTITATPSNAEAKVSGDVGIQKLNYGANIFTITVTSPLGTTKNYNITITRPLPSNTITESKDKNNNESKTSQNNSSKDITNQPKSSDASLKSLTIKNYNIDFKSNIYTYNLTVSNKIKDIEINAVPNNPNSKVVIDKKDNLEVGSNIITITVTSEDGTICKYILKVTRKNALSNDTSIKNIIIENYNLNFEEDKYDYTLKINDESTLKIKVILNDEKSTYKIKGNSNLKDKSIITITVTSEDKSTKDYTIEISKSTSQSELIINNLSLISIISILIIILIIIIILRKRIFKKEK